MLPSPLYESLPYVYVGVAILAVIYIDSSISVIAAVILIIAAAMIFMMRRGKRSKLKSSNGRTKSK